MIKKKTRAVEWGGRRFSSTSRKSSQCDTHEDERELEETKAFTGSITRLVDQGLSPLDQLIQMEEEAGT